MISYLMTKQAQCQTVATSRSRHMKGKAGMKSNVIHLKILTMRKLSHYGIGKNIYAVFK